MNELDNLREKINALDEELLTLFKKRMDISKKIGEYKIKNHMPILDISREEEIINKALTNLNNKELEPYFIEFYKTLLKVSKDLQRKRFDE
jgi:monofunctional chorismate mutase